MRFTLSLGLLMALAIPGSTQQRGAQPALLPLMGCGDHGDVEVCGTRQAEDLELTPDGKYLIATQFFNAGRGAPTGGGMALFDLARKSLSKMAEAAVPAIRPAPVPLAMPWFRMAPLCPNGVTALGNSMWSSTANANRLRCTS
jgi:hypothetical protein